MFFPKFENFGGIFRSGVIEGPVEDLSTLRREVSSAEFTAGTEP